jgi:hypothetical protein
MRKVPTPTTAPIVPGMRLLILGAGGSVPPPYASPLGGRSSTMSWSPITTSTGRSGRPAPWMTTASVRSGWTPRTRPRSRPCSAGSESTPYSGQPIRGTSPVRVGAVEVSPRDVVAACLPDPATLGDRMTGKTCAGTWVRGRGRDGGPRSSYPYHVVDNEWSMSEYGAQAVVLQTALNPIIALELIASGVWAGRLRDFRPGGLRRDAVSRPTRRRVQVAVARDGTTRRLAGCGC